MWVITFLLATKKICITLFCFLGWWSLFQKFLSFKSGECDVCDETCKTCYDKYNYNCVTCDYGYYMKYTNG